MTSSVNILLVDDSKFFLKIESQFLKKTPASILEAHSAEEAWQSCREAPPSLIYMAYEMFGTDGAECCRRLKADPELAEIPIVMICDAQKPEQAEICREAGGDEIITRPLDKHSFLEAGRKFLEGIREPRRTCLMAVTYRWQDKDLSGNGLDISQGGLFLASREDVGVGDKLELEVRLPDRAGTIRCRGEVAWLNTPDNPRKPNHPVGFGVRFTEMGEAGRRHLQRFLARRPGN